jgi:hypothetical protein
VFSSAGERWTFIPFFKGNRFQRPTRVEIFEMLRDEVEVWGPVLRLNYRTKLPIAESNELIVSGSLRIDWMMFGDRNTVYKDPRLKIFVPRELIIIDSAVNGIFEASSNITPEISVVTSRTCGPLNFIAFLMIEAISVVKVVRPDDWAFSDFKISSK